MDEVLAHALVRKPGSPIVWDEKRQKLAATAAAARPPPVEDDASGLTAH